jgi:MFS family permease
MKNTKDNKSTPIIMWFGWIIILIFILYQALLQCAPTVMISPLMHDLKISLVQVGFLSSSFYITYLICQIPAGILLDSFGPKKMLPIMIVLSGISCLIFQHADSSHTAVLGRLIMGLACAPGIIGGFYIASQYLPKHLFPLLAGITEMMGTLGGAIGEVFLSHSVKLYGWRDTMLICSICAFIIAAIAWVLLKKLHKTSKKITQSIAIDPSQYAPNNPKTTFLSDLKLMLVNAQIWINIFYCGLLYTIIASFAQLWAIPFIKERYVFSTQQAALTTAMLFIGASLGLIFFGALVSKIGKYRQVMFISSVICLIDLCVILYVPNIPLVITYFLFLILGFFCASYAIPFSVVKTLTPPKAHGTAMGLTNMLCVIPGTLILQPLIPVLLTYISKINHKSTQTLTNTDYRYALSVITLCVVIGVILSLFMKDEY